APAADERQPASVEAPRVLGHLAARGVQTLAFSPSRKLAELSVGRATNFVGEHADRYDVEPAECSLGAYHAGLGR
ncbi:MAG: hypothetical protein ABEJ42_01665, partial [Halobacteriaceae archaeon]